MLKRLWKPPHRFGTNSGNVKVVTRSPLDAAVCHRRERSGICSGTSPSAKNGRSLKDSPSYAANYRYYLPLPSCVRMHKFDGSYFVDPFSPDGLHAMYTSISTCTHLPGSLPSFYVQPQLLSFSLPLPTDVRFSPFRHHLLIFHRTTPWWKHDCVHSNFKRCYATLRLFARHCMYVCTRVLLVVF